MFVALIAGVLSMLLAARLLLRRGGTGSAAQALSPVTVPHQRRAATQTYGDDAR